jgi:hypothetical protein
LKNQTKQENNYILYIDIRKIGWEHSSDTFSAVLQFPLPIKLTATM